MIFPVNICAPIIIDPVISGFLPNVMGQKMIYATM